MLTRAFVLTIASTLLFTAAASAEGVIAGKAVEVRRVDRPLVGASERVRLSDGQTIKISQADASVLVATQLIAPEAIVAMPEVKARTVPVIVTSAPRGTEPVPVVIVAKGRGLEGGTSTNVFPAETVALSGLQPSDAIAVPAGEPIVVMEGYYVVGSETDEVAQRPIRLKNGTWITIADRAWGPMPAEPEVDFDPAALQPGRYVRIIKREDGTYFLTSAAEPRVRLGGVPAGKVNRVDQRAQVIELSDGTMVHPVKTVLRVRDQAIDPATLRPGNWVVIDPNPALGVEAPSALPADVVVSGKVMDVRRPFGPGR
jgi:hypothetical protein